MQKKHGSPLPLKLCFIINLPFLVLTVLLTWTMYDISSFCVCQGYTEGQFWPLSFVICMYKKKKKGRKKAAVYF